MIRFYPENSRLTFISHKPGSIKSVYRCSCGVEKEIRTQYVKSGKTLSCGCYSKELNTAAMAKYRTVNA